MPRDAVQVLYTNANGGCRGVGVVDVDSAPARRRKLCRSKFVDGQPVFDENGKIAKGPYYKPVDLTGLY